MTIVYCYLLLSECFFIKINFESDAVMTIVYCYLLLSECFFIKINFESDAVMTIVAAVVYYVLVMVRKLSERVYFFGSLFLLFLCLFFNFFASAAIVVHDGNI